MTNRSVGLIAIALAVAALAVGCSGPLSRLVRPPSPYERYAASLASSGLDQAALGRDWIQAGERALAEAVTVTSPFRETGYLSPVEPSAVAYRLNLNRGRRLTIDVTLDAATPATLFVDLFEVRDAESPRHIAALDPAARTVTHDIERDGAYLVRIQPELLRGGRFTIIERTLSSLAFPVSGLSSRGIGSIFGAARDAGTRDHEGVDIFAPRGTPAVAVVDGTAQSDTNGLGGNVLWLFAAGGGPRFYYAHLDRWHVTGRASVRTGDVVGYVGNTGNARTTTPHLHFGVYDRGAIDPTPFLRPDDPTPAAPGADEDVLGALVRMTPAQTAMREGAARTAAARRQLVRATLARVVGASQQSYRVRLPDTSEGYVNASAVAPIDTPVRRDRIAPGAVLLELPQPGAPVVATLASASDVDVLGRFGAFDFVRDANQRTGWIETRE